MNKKKKSRKNYRKYKKEDLENALDAIINKKQSIRRASKEFKVLFSTLLIKKNGKVSVKARSGPATVLSSDEESMLLQWIIHLSATGFCVTKDQLLDSVQKLVKDLKKKTPFTNSRPSKHWYNAFLKRHPEISEKMAQNISLRRAEITEESIRKWFKEVRKYLDTKNLLNISGSRIFNCDESAFLLNSKAKKVLSFKEKKMFITG